MDQTKQIAKQFRAVYFGGNWTVSCMKEHLADVSWQQATRVVNSLNTIAKLVYHTGYFVSALHTVLKGEELTAKDEFSFDLPPILCKEDWDKLLEKTWTDVENTAKLIEQLPENKLGENFTDEKYGNYYRNIHGIIEHTHYHLGQIVLIKKMILEKNKNS